MTEGRVFKRVVFGDEFSVEDSHIETFLSIPSSFLSGILAFGLGDAEKYRGHGATDLTDVSLLALFKNCPRLRYVHFSGNDSTPGDLKGTALDALREDPKMGEDLVKLRLTDQNTPEKKFQAAVKALSTKRKKLY